MMIDDEYTCDVLVIGSGIAGSSAALEAARAGARVVIASLGATFSGSSFSGGTWGLGLIGPLDDQDAADLERTIHDVGRGVTDSELVHTLVGDITPAIRWLETMGVVLRRPVDATQREYIPCFDHSVRSWHGLERTSLRAVCEREFNRLEIVSLPHTELIDLIEEDGRITGGMLATLNGQRICQVRCNAVVLASGGLGGLYERSLTPPDTAGSVQGIALKHACSLVNAEFLQIMPGLTHPIVGIVVNEKAFRYSTLDVAPELLDERSGYGPFTSRLPSHAIDLLVSEAGTEGLPFSYRLPEVAPEFVSTYFNWLRDTYGILASDQMRMALFAHASNGGIAIDERGACLGGPYGLFACGECAGGMHGADRIGGLASASALVFERRAGSEAARISHGAVRESHPTHVALSAVPASDSMRLTGQLRQLMSTYALVGRTEEGLTGALQAIGDIQSHMQTHATPCEDVRQYAASKRLEHQLIAASAMLAAMLERKESRGSHHRADFPDEDPSLAHPLYRMA